MEVKFEFDFFEVNEIWVSIRTSIEVTKKQLIKNPYLTDILNPLIQRKTKLADKCDQMIQTHLNS